MGTLPKGFTMGLFTNRKREEDEITAAVPASAEASPGRARRLEDQPQQAGNVEIDAAGLRALLGVDDDASLVEISAACQRFVDEHRPSDADDVDAAELKERIRREINTAYASFRLTQG